MTDPIVARRIEKLKKLLNAGANEPKVVGYKDTIHNEVVYTTKYHELETMVCCGGCPLVFTLELE